MISNGKLSYVYDGLNVVPTLANSSGVAYTVITDFDGTSTALIVTTDTDEETPYSSLCAYAQNYVYNGASWDRVRGSKVLKTASVSAVGETTIWTPTGGTSWNLMGYTISIAGTLAALGVQTIQLLDGVGGTVFINHVCAVAATLTGDTQIGADLGQGRWAAAPDTPLRIKLGTAMASGAVTINVWGTEE